jgi:hypothetical protein
MATSATCPPASVGPFTIGRRGFILGGMLLAASTSVVGGLVLREGPSALARLAAADGPRLSIGFVEGARTLAEAHGLPLVPAGAVAAGDPRLLGQAVRVRVQGATPGFGPDVLPDVAALALDALVPSPADPEREVLPFHAWGVRRGPHPQTSSPMRFSAEVAPEPTLALRLGLTRAVGAEEASAEGAAAGEDPVAVFTAGGEAGRPKLREGLFLVGMRPGTWEAGQRVPEADDPAWPGLVSIVVSVEAVAADGGAADGAAA